MRPSNSSDYKVLYSWIETMWSGAKLPTLEETAVFVFRIEE